MSVLYLNQKDRERVWEAGISILSRV